MVQEFSTLVDLAEDLGLIPNTYIAVNSHL